MNTMRRYFSMAESFLAYMSAPTPRNEEREGASEANIPLPGQDGYHEVSTLSIALHQLGMAKHVPNLNSLDKPH